MCELLYYRRALNKDKKLAQFGYTYISEGVFRQNCTDVHSSFVLHKP